MNSSRRAIQVVAGVAFIAAPLCYLAAQLLLLLVPDRVADNLAAWTAAHLALFAWSVWLVPAMLGLGFLLWPRGAAYALVGGALATFGNLIVTLFTGIDFVVGEMAQLADRAGMEALSRRISEDLIGPLDILDTALDLGLLVLGIGLYRLRAAPPWPVVVFLLGLAIPGGGWLKLPSGVVQLVGLGWLGWGLLTGSSEHGWARFGRPGLVAGLLAVAYLPGALLSLERVGFWLLVLLLLCAPELSAGRMRAPPRLLERPVLFAVLVASVSVAVDSLLGALVGGLKPELSSLEIGSLTGAILAALAAAVLWWLGWWDEVVPRRSGWRALLVFLPFALHAPLPLAAGVHANATGIVSSVVAGALIAFWKLGALGLMLRALRPRGVWPAPCLAALLFGLMHLGALFVGGSPLPTLLVSLSYLFYGFAAAAVIVRTGLLWPLVLTYAVFLASAAATQDPHAPNLVASVEMILPALVVSAVLAIYGFLVLRPATHALDPGAVPAPGQTPTGPA